MDQSEIVCSFSNKKCRDGQKPPLREKRRVLREELQAVPSQPVKQQEDAIPQEMMGFLGSLLEED